MEQIPTPGPKHERELAPGDANLETVRNTPLHDELSDNPTYEQLVGEKSISVDDMYHFSDQEGFIYVKIDASDVETAADIGALLDTWNLDDTSSLGYGTGPANVGFSRAAMVIDNINRYGMGNADNLYLYIPIKISQGED